MAETAAHLVDHGFPPLPVRQWVLAVPKRLRTFLQRDTTLQGTVLRIFLSVVERYLGESSPACPATARIGAVAFIHRFGSSLNEQLAAPAKMNILTLVALNSLSFALSAVWIWYYHSAT